MYAMCVEMNAHSKLEFTKTIDPKPMNSSFKVTLGVMPDYMFSGVGMRIDGVKENRPAALAGLKQGDIVVRLGENKIADMSSYMEALGKFNEGDSTEVEFIREGKSIVSPVTFK
jgi:S1-C subfamily serine protease